MSVHRSGHGQILYPDGSLYHSAVSCKKRTTGSKFEGEFDAGEQVRGKVEFTSGTIYEGEFRDAKPHGRGSITFASKAKFEGEFVDGAKHGVGSFEATDGSRYEGEWQNDAVTGTGRMTYADGRTYHGTWLDGFRHGEGRCTYSNGSVYVGAWQNDERVGFGEMYHADGSSYKGEWSNSQPHGRGSYIFTNGDCFSGEWLDGKRHGQGKYEFSKFEPGQLPVPPTQASSVSTNKALSSAPTPPMLAPPIRVERCALVYGGPDKINGTYRALGKPGLYGEVVYENRRNRMFLYHIDSGSHYAIGRKKNAPACICFTRHENASAKGHWMLYDQSQWVAAAGLAVRFLDNVDSDNNSNDCAPAVAVSSRYSNISGGYVRLESETVNGRPVYKDDEDGKYLWYGPTGAWIVSDSAGVSGHGSYSSYVSSEPTNASSPENADWSKAGVSVRATIPPSEVTDLLERARQSERGLFRDPDFPPVASSIGDEVVSGTMPQDTLWIRPTVLNPPGEPLDLFNGIDPNDIMQGALGDCWLLSAVSALAEFPAFIEDSLFVTKRLSPTGRYELRMYDAAEARFKIVVFDDAIPCAPPKWWEWPRPLFAQPSQNEIYILLIEKCFAKLAGSYSKLSGGYPLLAWMTMTGCEDLQSWKRSRAGGALSRKWQLSQVAVDKVRENPFNFQRMYTRATDDFKSDAQLFDYLVQCDGRNYIMAASISGSSVEKARDDGLVERHAYSLIAVKRSHEFMLAKLRNPWGNEREWKGEWSDGSAEWARHPEVKRDLDHHERDDGIFWMQFADFVSIFDGIQICAIEMPAASR